jgi:hypothetical protein
MAGLVPVIPVFIARIERKTRMTATNAGMTVEKLLSS